MFSINNVHPRSVSDVVCIVLLSLFFFQWKYASITGANYVIGHELGHILGFVHFGKFYQIFSDNEATGSFHRCINPFNAKDGIVLGLIMSQNRPGRPSRREFGFFDFFERFFGLFRI